MNALVKGPLAIAAAWLAVAVAVHTLASIVTLGGPTLWVAVAYALSLGSTFTLHRSTRGPLMIAFAFVLTATLVARGAYLAITADDWTLGRRVAVAVALALPLVLLVARRWTVDAEDDWFARRSRPVVLGSLLVAVPLFAAGIVGATRADPSAYDRALGSLHCHPVELLARPEAAGGAPLNAELLAPGARVTPAVRAEVEGECRRFESPELACGCAHTLLRRRVKAIEKRRDTFRSLALASALPFAMVVLFAWRGRRSLARAEPRGTRSATE